MMLEKPPQFTPEVHRVMTEPVLTVGKEPYSVLPSGVALMPPSPPLTSFHVVPAEVMVMVLLSCNPPRMALSCPGKLLKPTNSLSEPRPALKLVNGSVVQAELFNPAALVVRYRPPSFPK